MPIAVSFCSPVEVGRDEAPVAQDGDEYYASAYGRSLMAADVLLTRSMMSCAVIRTHSAVLRWNLVACFSAGAERAALTSGCPLPPRRFFGSLSGRVVCLFIPMTCLRLSGNARPRLGNLSPSRHCSSLKSSSLAARVAGFGGLLPPSRRVAMTMPGLAAARFGLPSAAAIARSDTQQVSDSGRIDARIPRNTARRFPASRRSH